MQINPIIFNNELASNDFSFIPRYSKRDYVKIHTKEKNTLKHFRIPCDLNRDDILGPKITAKFIPSALILLAVIRIRTNIIAMTDKRSESEMLFAPIHSRTIKNFFTSLSSQYKLLLEAMEQADWIEINHSYTTGKKSKGYMIGSRFRNSDWKTAEWETEVTKHLPELDTSKQLKGQPIMEMWNRASLYFDQSFRINGIKDPILKSICLQTEKILKGLTVNDRINLEKLIKDCAKDKASEPTTKKKSEHHIRTEQEQEQFYLNMVNALESDEHYVVCNDDRSPSHTDRIYTNYTNLKKEFSPFVLLDGKPLYKIDIQSCQPALMSLFYLDNERDKKEKEKYVDILLNRDIYKYLAEKNSTIPGNDPMTRKEAKNGAFLIMFGEIYKQRTDLCRVFRQEFPILNIRLNEHKQKNYKAVSRILQSLESKIMVHGVLNELLLQKKIRCLSVHDSIACFEEHVTLAQDAITKHFLEAVGFRPVLNIERPGRRLLPSPSESDINQSRN
jgi:hypothetical protein